MSGGFNNPIIGGGGALVYPSIESPNFSMAGQTGWAILKNGSAFFFNVTASGTITALILAVSGSAPFGGLVKITNTHAAPSFATTQLITAAPGDEALAILASGDTSERWQIYSDGKMTWGPGNAPPDANLYHPSAGVLKTDGELDVASILKALAGLSVTGGETADTIAIASPQASNPVLKVTNNTPAPSGAIVQIDASAAGDQSLAIFVSADTHYRLQSDSNGRLAWSSGAALPDVTLQRAAANLLSLTTADLDIITAGRGLRVAEGSNAKQGTATLSAGTKLVSNTSVTANSRIFLTAQDNSSTGALRVSARTPGTSFTITSSNAADSGVVAYEIIEPG